MPAVLFLAAEGPIAEVSNTSLKDFIGKTLGHNKQMFFFPSLWLFECHEQRTDDRLTSNAHCMAPYFIAFDVLKIGCF
jgi:hypothetical protein